MYVTARSNPHQPASSASRREDRSGRACWRVCAQGAPPLDDDLQCPRRHSFQRAELNARAFCCSAVGLVLARSGPAQMAAGVRLLGDYRTWPKQPAMADSALTRSVINGCAHSRCTDPDPSLSQSRPSQALFEQISILVMDEANCSNPMANIVWDISYVTRNSGGQFVVAPQKRKADDMT